MIESKDGAEERTRTFTPLRAPAPQDDTSRVYALRILGSVMSIVAQPARSC
jgi:hypothetical protein